MPDEFSIEFDARQFEQAAQDLGAAADQLPYVLSKSLNEAMKFARLVMIEQTWPQHVTQRNASFLRGAAFGYGSMQWATKENLTVELRDISGNRAHLAQHARGGTITPRGQRLAIPVSSWVQRGPHGVYKRMTPRALRDQKNVVTLARGIFEALGGRLHLRYSFKPQAQQPADVPFNQTWQDSIEHALDTIWDDVIAYAMRTRR